VRPEDREGFTTLSLGLSPLRSASRHAFVKSNVEQRMYPFLTAAVMASKPCCCPPCFPFPLSGLSAGFKRFLSADAPPQLPSYFPLPESVEDSFDPPERTCLRPRRKREDPGCLTVMRLCVGKPLFFVPFPPSLFCEHLRRHCTFAIWSPLSALV